MVFGDLFGSFDETTLRNPIWETIGYPGPNSAAPSPAAGAEDDPTREASPAPRRRSSADVCVVGSGAGGAVIAARLAAAGKSVLVLEMGGYSNESDFRQLEAEGAADVPRRRHQLVGGRRARPARRLDPRRRHGDQLDGLPADSPTRSAPSGRRRGSRASTAPNGTATSTRSGSALGANSEATAVQPQRRGADRGALRLRARAPPDPAQRRARRRPAVLRLLQRRLPAGLQALGAEELPAGCRRRRRPLPRRLHRRAGRDPRRASAPGSRRGLARPRSRSRHRRWSSPAAGSSRRRCCCARGSAGRRSARTSASTRPT